MELLQRRQKQVEDKDNYIIIAVPAINMSLTPLRLPVATLGNNGGYRELTVEGNIVAAYSPVDIAICGLAALYNGEQLVTSLNNWFISNPCSLSMLWVTCSIVKSPTRDVYTSIDCKNMLEWEVLGRNNSKLRTVLKKNAPFTFRRS